MSAPWGLIVIWVGAMVLLILWLYRRELSIRYRRRTGDFLNKHMAKACDVISHFIEADYWSVEELAQVMGCRKALAQEQLDWLVKRGYIGKKWRHTDKGRQALYFATKEQKLRLDAVAVALWQRAKPLRPSKYVRRKPFAKKTQ